MENLKAYDDNLKLFYEYQRTKDKEVRNQIALNNYNLIYIGLRGLYIEGDRKTVYYNLQR